MPSILGEAAYPGLASVSSNSGCASARGRAVGSALVGLQRKLRQEKQCNQRQRDDRGAGRKRHGDRVAIKGDCCSMGLGGGGSKLPQSAFCEGGHVQSSGGAGS